MKEKIIEILKEKAKCTMNMHSDFDNVDETQFETIADEIVKLYNLQNISNHVCPNCGSHETTVCEIFCMDCEEYYNDMG